MNTKLNYQSLFWVRVLPGLLAWTMLGPAAVLAQRPSTDRHVPELSAHLDRVQIAEPVTYRNLAVYPVLVPDARRLEGRWLTMDAAISRGVLVITEKGEGSVPVVVVENRSRDEHVLVTSGEVISGGKQTRTVRHDTVLAPGQRVDLAVLCVEANRWQGGKDFSAGKTLVPQSIQKELRQGADQQRIWAEVARSNAALGAENSTGSLERALKAAAVQDKLADVRRAIVPGIPDGAMGFIFVDRHRALGAELFGSQELARALLPKLLDSYAVDCVILRKEPLGGVDRTGHQAAIDFFQRVCRAGSHRSDTPGSGAGMRTRADGLLGDGVSLSGTLVHYGVQIQDRIVPLPGPVPRPRIIFPQ